MSHACELSERRETATICVRTRCRVQDLAHVVRRALAEVLTFAARHGVPPNGPPYAAYHGLDQHNVDVEIGFPLPRALQGWGHLMAGVIPGGTYARTLHVGPYNQLGRAYEELRVFATSQRRNIGSPVYEMYLDGPGTPPEKIRTLILFPVDSSPRSVPMVAQRMAG